MKNKKEIGAGLENYILAKVKETDSQARLSRGSGCGNDIGDIVSYKFFIECKKRNTKSVQVNNNVWNHLLAHLPINTQKIPLLALENHDSKRWIVIDCEDFFRLMKGD